MPVHSVLKILQYNKFVFAASRRDQSKSVVIAQLHQKLKLMILFKCLSQKRKCMFTTKFQINTLMKCEITHPASMY